MSSTPLDPQRTRVTLRRALAGAPAQLAEGFARVVRNSSGERLERLMRTPARRLVLDGIFWQMPRFLDRKRAAGLNSSIRWQITGRSDDQIDTYQLEFKDGVCQVIRGSRGPEPRVTITVDGVEFLRIATGGSDPMRAYFDGRIAVAGDIMVAAKLTSVFVIPGGS